MVSCISQQEKISIALLVVQAVICVVFILSPISSADILPFIMAFPYAQIGQGLRALSLSGAVGNAIAIVLYGFVCLLPMSVLLFIRGKRAVDAILPLISIVLFVVMYYMINPGVIPMVAGHIEQAVLGSIVHSLILAYLVMKILQLFGAATDLGRYIGVMLHLLNMLFVFVIFGLVFSRMIAAFTMLEAGNTGSNQLGMTYAFLVLQHVVNALPYALNIWVVFAALRLHSAFRNNQYSDETIAAARCVSQVCTMALAVTVLTGAGFNLLQLIFIRRLHVVSSNINFPVASILFVLGALLLTRYIAENQLLKDENDQFV